jgi:hypothetical protein
MISEFFLNCVMMKLNEKIIKCLIKIIGYSLFHCFLEQTIILELREHP